MSDFVRSQKAVDAAIERLKESANDPIDPHANDDLPDYVPLSTSERDVLAIVIPRGTPKKRKPREH